MGWRAGKGLGEGKGEIEPAVRRFIVVGSRWGQGCDGRPGEGSKRA